MTVYPSQSSKRGQWIIDQRGPRNPVDPFIPYAFISEEEPDANRNLKRITTLFLTNRECPWKCVFCDLWRNTLPDTVPRGAIPAQIGYALERLPDASWIKLYNSGSFFDPRAIPPEDYPAIASRVRRFERVIVECHPALVTYAWLPFQKMLRGQLEVAIGLETAHPGSLAKLNKGMTLAQFSSAAQFLKEHRIELRIFLLVNPPFVEAANAGEWVRRSIDVAFDAGADVVSLIPARGGNGAMETLESLGQFTPPALADLERAVDYGLSLGRGRVFADLWDLERFARCRQCFEPRRARLERMNREQLVLPPVMCECVDNCGAGFSLPLGADQDTLKPAPQ